jgi:RHS repeat-associated protein
MMPFTGYLYYGFRVYDAGMGRFTSVDPISDQFSELSTFNYASNNPAAKIDLHGLQGIYSNTGAAWLAEKQNPETGQGLYKQARNYDVVSGAGTVVGMAAFLAAGAAISAPEATAVFAANEVKDEVASQLTNGASDVLDATKMGAKLLKKGGSKIYRAVSKDELRDIKDSGLIRPGTNSMETKLFTESIDDATFQGTETGKDFSIISVEVPNSTMKELGVNTTIDKHQGGMSGNTIYVDPEKMELFNSTRGKVSEINLK